MNLQALLNSIFTLPKTQQDISKISQAAQQMQSPQMQAQLSAMRDDLSAAIGTQLVLQLVATASLVGIFVLLYKKR